MRTLAAVAVSEAAIRLPDEMDFRCAGYFVKAVGNEPTVSIRYCGDAFVMPSNLLDEAKRNANPCPAEKSNSIGRSLFDRLFSFVTHAPKQNQVRWGTATPAKTYNPHGQQSGFGFEGVRHATRVPTNGSEFYIGALVHYNFAVFGWVETVDLLVNISIGARMTQLSIPLRIHETPNDESACPYSSDHGVGCSDRVWMTARYVALPQPFTDAVRSADDAALPSHMRSPLVLMFRGAKMHPSYSTSELAMSFVSQERRNTYAYLYAAVVPLDQVKLLSKTAQ